MKTVLDRKLINALSKMTTYWIYKDNLTKNFWVYKAKGIFPLNHEYQFLCVDGKYEDRKETLKRCGKKLTIQDYDMAYDYNYNVRLISEHEFNKLQQKFSKKGKR